MFSYNLKEVFMARILPKWHYGFKDNSKQPFRIVLVGAALSVADGKDVDLNRIFKKVVG